MAKQERAERTRSALVTAAAEVFDQVGYERASLNAISEAAGVTKGALSFHFSTKAELARAVQSLACETSRTALGTLEERGGTPALQILIDMTHVLAHLLQHHTVVRAGVRLSRELGISRDSAHDCFLTWLEILEGVLQRAAADRSLAPGPDARTVTALALTMTTGTELLVRSRPEAPVLCETDGPHDAASNWLAGFWRLLLPEVASTGQLKPTGTLGPCPVGVLLPHGHT